MWNNLDIIWIYPTYGSVIDLENFSGVTLNFHAINLKKT